MLIVSALLSKCATYALCLRWIAHGWDCLRHHYFSALGVRLQEPLQHSRELGAAWQIPTHPSKQPTEMGFGVNGMIVSRTHRTHRTYRTYTV